jgi:nitroreductase
MTTITDDVRERYGTDEALPAVADHPVVRHILRHRSVRAFRDAALPPHTLETLVAAAQSAATSSNLQAWSVVAVNDPARRARIAEWCGGQSHIVSCPLFLVWLADLARLERIAEGRGLPSAALDYTELFVLGVIDAALAAQNAVLAAEALGLGTVYIGAVRNRPLEVAAELRLPPRVFPVFGLCVGWPDEAEAAAVKPRLPQSAVLHHEVYHDDPAAVVRYNQAMAHFYAAQQMRVRGDWSDHSARRVAGPETLAGRDVLRDAIEQRGFPLR